MSLYLSVNQLIMNLHALIGSQKWWSNEHFEAAVQSWKSSPEALNLGIRKHGQNSAWPLAHCSLVVSIKLQISTSWICDNKYFVDKRADATAKRMFDQRRLACIENPQLSAHVSR